MSTLPENERESESTNSSLAIHARRDGNKMYVSRVQIAWWMAGVSIAPDGLFAEEESIDL